MLKKLLAVSCLTLLAACAGPAPDQVDAQRAVPAVDAQAFLRAQAHTDAGMEPCPFPEMGAPTTENVGYEMRGNLIAPDRVYFSQGAREHAIMVRNSGHAPLEVTSATIYARGPGATWEVLPPSGPESCSGAGAHLEPGAACVIGVRFSGVDASKSSSFGRSRFYAGDLVIVHTGVNRTNGVTLVFE